MLNIHGKVSVIQNSKKNVLSVQSNNKNMLVGFPTQNMAARVCMNLPVKPQLSLTRKASENIALDVKRSLMQLNVPIRNVADNITVDVSAELVIHKELPREYELNDTIDILIFNDFHVDDVLAMDFMMYPFDRNIGIVIPYSLDFENDDKYVFTCNVIEPSDDINYFLRSFIY
jgi:hypothetical protein